MPLRKERKPTILVVFIIAVLLLTQFSNVCINADNRANAASQAVTSGSSASSGLNIAAELTPDNVAVASDFGEQVSISGDSNTAFVSAVGETVNGQTAAGAVYVFTKSGNTWSQTQKLTASDAKAYDNFGKAMSLSNDGSTALIAANSLDISNAGKVYVFTKNGDVWVQQAVLHNADNTSTDNFGSTLSLSNNGSIALIGAAGHRVGSLFVGAAYIFTRNGNTWNQTQELLSSGSTYFGEQASLSGDGSTALISAATHTINGKQADGAAYIFANDGAQWVQQNELTVASTDGYFGSVANLSKDGSTVLIGSINETVNGVVRVGAMYVFTKNGNTWSQTQRLTASDASTDGNFSGSASLSGDGSLIIIGASEKTVNNQSAAGAAYVFSKNGTTWNQIQELTAPDGFSAAEFGRSISISNDGETTLIAAKAHSLGNAKSGVGYVLNNQANIITTTGQSQTWRNSGFQQPITEDSAFVSSCLDATQPNRILYGDKVDTPNGTYAYNWLTGAKTFVSSNILYKCNGTQLYSYTSGQPPIAKVFSIDDPNGKAITYLPDYFAPVNPQLLYSIGSADPNLNENHSLWVSNDGGQTWQDHSPEPGNSLSIALASNDGKAIYTLALHSNQKGDSFTLYFSADAGATWQKRYQSTFPGNYLEGLNVTPLIGQNSPNYVALFYSQVSTSPIDSMLLSTDGGHTFNEVGQIYYPVDLQLFYTNSGIIRQQSNPNSSGYTLARSQDGRNWQNLTLPFQPAKTATYLLNQDANAPDNLFLNDPTTGDLWWSADAGTTWKKEATGFVLVDPQIFDVISYSPFTLAVMNNDHKLYLLDGLQRTVPVAADTTTPGNMFFKETGHNLSGVFLKYWQAHGGLAQFGFPKTEQFKEYNPADGKFYLVQYFERNRFEYHPEFAGSQYEVELGLLGNQQTANRHQETPFQPVKNPNTAGTMFFSQTGHTLSGKFLSYWNANGGLAIYGYPISEPFQEVNPDDGKTYTVQYFERNRFEYHPEFANSKYEVELGLLGNTLLKSEGWLQ